MLHLEQLPRSLQSQRPHELAAGLVHDEPRCEAGIEHLRPTPVA